MNILDQTSNEKGYHCECKDGYEWDEDTQACKDIDECKSTDPELNKCLRNDKLVCVNQDGYQNHNLGYTCFCENGYVERSLFMRSVIFHMLHVVCYIPYA